MSEEKSLWQMAFEAFQADSLAHGYSMFAWSDIGSDARSAWEAESEIKRTAYEWCERFETQILDPDGWRRDQKSFGEPIDSAEFVRRWIESSTDGTGNLGFRMLVQKALDDGLKSEFPKSSTKVKTEDVIQMAETFRQSEKQEKASIDALHKSTLDLAEHLSKMPADSLTAMIVSKADERLRRKNAVIVDKLIADMNEGCVNQLTEQQIAKLEMIREEFVQRNLIANRRFALEEFFHKVDQLVINTDKGFPE